MNEEGLAFAIAIPVVRQMNEEGLAFAIAIPVVRQMNEEGLAFAIAIPVVSLGMVAQMLNPYYSSIMSNAKTLLRYYKF